MRAIGFFALAPLVAVACSLDASAPPEVEDSDPTSVVGASFDVSQLPAEVAPTDRIAHGDVGVLAPDPGVTVGAELHGVDGKTERLVVQRTLDGVLHVVDLNETETVMMSSPAPCADSAYHHEGFSWNQKYEWWFRAGSVPSGYDKTKVESALRRAMVNIVGSRNDCGMADRVSATAAYQGRTTTASNIVSTTSSVTCGKNDGKNVVTFGALPSQYLGLTCYWYDGNKHAIEADVKLNGHYHAWFTGSRVPSGCSNRFSIEATATHEFGHVFGLAHVPESTHGNLTMSPSMGPCTMAPASLGKGDVLGLRSLY
jgi:hypothetical protein